MSTEFWEVQYLFRRLLANIQNFFQTDELKQFIFKLAYLIIFSLNFSVYLLKKIQGLKCNKHPF